MRRVPIIWLEGIIGSGKTSFAREVGKRLEFRVLEEPVDTNPYLAEFYRDPRRWAWPMQIHLLHYRFGLKKLADYSAATGAEKGIIVDRSIAGDRVFAKLHYEIGNISKLEWETYEFAYQMLARDLQPPTTLIYLDVQPRTALERIQKRNRTVENGLELSYLVELRDGYNALLQELQRGLCPWAHSVEALRIVWDRETVAPTEWDSVAATVASACLHADTSNGL